MPQLIYRMHGMSRHSGFLSRDDTGEGHQFSGERCQHYDACADDAATWALGIPDGFWGFIHRYILHRYRCFFLPLGLVHYNELFFWWWNLTTWGLWKGPTWLQWDPTTLETFRWTHDPHTSCVCWTTSCTGWNLWRWCQIYSGWIKGHRDYAELPIADCSQWLFMH